MGGIDFVQVSIFPDAGQPEELSLLVLFQRRLRDWRCVGAAVLTRHLSSQPPRPSGSGAESSEVVEKEKGLPCQGL